MFGFLFCSDSFRVCFPFAYYSCLRRVWCTTWLRSTGWLWACRELLELYTVNGVRTNKRLYCQNEIRTFVFITVFVNALSFIAGIELNTVHLPGSCVLQHLDLGFTHLAVPCGGVHISVASCQPPSERSHFVPWCCFHCIACHQNTLQRSHHSIRDHRALAEVEGAKPAVSLGTSEELSNRCRKALEVAHLLSTKLVNPSLFISRLIRFKTRSLRVRMV